MRNAEFTRPPGPDWTSAARQDTYDYGADLGQAAYTLKHICNVRPFRLPALGGLYHHSKAPVPGPRAGHKCSDLSVAYFNFQLTRLKCRRTALFNFRLVFTPNTLTARLEAS